MNKQTEDRELRFPTRDADIRKMCQLMIGLSKTSVNKLTKSELISICKKRGYLI